MRIVEAAMSDHPTILYHASNAADRESIMRDGLLRSRSEAHQTAMDGGFSEDEGPFGGIFFSSKIEQRKHGIDTWQVDVRGLHIQPDDTTDPEDPDDTWWVTYDEDVSPERLKLMFVGMLR